MCVHLVVETINQVYQCFIAKKITVIVRAYSCRDNKASLSMFYY